MKVTKTQRHQTQVVTSDPVTGKIPNPNFKTATITSVNFLINLILILIISHHNKDFMRFAEGTLENFWQKCTRLYEER
jgi:hypothetical protein